MTFLSKNTPFRSTQAGYQVVALAGAGRVLLTSLLASPLPQGVNAAWLQGVDDVFKYNLAGAGTTEFFAVPYPYIVKLTNRQQIEACMLFSATTNVRVQLFTGQIGATE